MRASRSARNRRRHTSNAHVCDSSRLGASRRPPYCCCNCFSQLMIASNSETTRWSRGARSDGDCLIRFICLTDVLKHVECHSFLFTQRLPIAESLAAYAVHIVRATRPVEPSASGFVMKYVTFGGRGFLRRRHQAPYERDGEVTPKKLQYKAAGAPRVPAGVVNDPPGSFAARRSDRAIGAQIARELLPVTGLTRMCRKANEGAQQRRVMSHRHP